MNILRRLSIAMPCLLAITFSSNVAADNESFPTPENRFGLGLVMHTQSPEYKDHDTAAVGLFPFFRGERINVDHDEIAFDFTPDKNISLEVLATQQHLGYDSSESNVFKGMEDRHAIWGLGGRATATGDWGQARLGMYFNPIDDDEVPDADSGSSVQLSYGFPMAAGAFEITPTVGYQWYSEEVVDFLYGVSAADATSTRAAYQGDAAGIPYVGVSIEGMLSNNVRLAGGLRYESLPNEIADSPLVDDDKTFRAQLGVAWLF